jgi:metallo-beta-lactamase class B
VLRSLPADIWVTSHARLWDRYLKFVARETAKNPADPFIDPEGYRACIDTAEAEFREGVVHSQCRKRRVGAVGAARHQLFGTIDS